MLDALKDAGVDMMRDCLRGECGLCAVRVLDVDGELDHRDVFLDDEEQSAGETMLTCVSRAVGGAVTVDTGFRAGPRAQAGVQRVETPAEAAAAYARPQARRSTRKAARRRVVSQLGARRVSAARSRRHSDSVRPGGTSHST
jgi:hypothetical protein